MSSEADKLARSIERRLNSYEYREYRRQRSKKKSPKQMIYADGFPGSKELPQTEYLRIKEQVSPKT